MLLLPPFSRSSLVALSQRIKFYHDFDLMLCWYCADAQRLTRPHAVAYVINRGQIQDFWKGGSYV